MKKIEIEIKEITTKEGQKFNSVTAFQKDGKRIRCHFRKEVDNVPKEQGRYFMNCQEENLSINKTKKYPQLWVAKIESIDTFDKIQDETARKIVSEFFNDAE